MSKNIETPATDDGAGPSDTEMLDYLASMWNSEGNGHEIMGRRFDNPTGSLRDAIKKKMKEWPI